MRLLSTLIFTMFFAGYCLADDLSVTVSQGKLMGAYADSAKSVRVFKSIPYALPPTGNRRWKPAAPPIGWEATRLATRFSPNCVQQPYPEGSFFSASNAPTSEDCLYLNVWSPVKVNDKLPVMVWIHGGGLTRGTGATPAYDGTSLVEKGVVLVTINYRLGIFGYFAHPELTAESPDKAAGNYGTTDQIAALAWIRDNIEAFGGDPGNVTVFGESAGSFSVNHLMASPLARGLFHRAIGESGSALGPMADLREGDDSGEIQGMQFAASINVSSLRELREMPAAELLAKSLGARFRPVVDGWVFPETIYSIFSKGRQNPVPLIVGFNADEGTTLGVLSQIPEDADSYTARITSLMGPFTDEFLSIYPSDNLRKSTLEAFRDSFATWGMQSWAMMMQKVNQPAFLYYFSHWPNGEQLGAYHAGEIIYAFNNAAKIKEGATESDLQLADTMSSYWVAFAKSGNPNFTDAPVWEPYTRDKRSYIEFKDGQAIPAMNLLPGRWEFFDKVNAQKRSL